MKAEMSTKERIEAAIFKKDADRLPFWPKLTETYRRFQPRGASATLEQMHVYIGSDVARYTEIGTLRRPVDGIEVKKERTAAEEIVTYAIDKRVLIERNMLTQEAGDSHPVEYPIKSLEDIMAMTKYYETGNHYVAPSCLEAHRRHLEAAPDGFFFASMSATPVMELAQYKAGLENFVYFLADYPDEMETLIAAMHRDYLQRLELTCQSMQTDYILATENTSSTMISPWMFTKYCRPHLTDAANLVKSYGKHLILHMCGKLKAFLPDIAKIPAVAMEAFTSATVGDTGIKDGFTMLPGKGIIGGTCASTWLLGEKEIIDRILFDIAEAGGTRGLYLTSAGVMPFSASVEKIKAVRSAVLSGLKN